MPYYGGADPSAHIIQRDLKRAFTLGAAVGLPHLACISSVLGRSLYTLFPGCDATPRPAVAQEHSVIIHPLGADQAPPDPAPPLLFFTKWAGDATPPAQFNSNHFCPGFLHAPTDHHALASLLGLRLFHPHPQATPINKTEQDYALTTHLTDEQVSQAIAAHMLALCRPDSRKRQSPPANPAQPKKKKARTSTQPSPPPSLLRKRTRTGPPTAPQAAATSAPSHPKRPTPGAQTAKMGPVKRLKLDGAPTSGPAAHVTGNDLQPFQPGPQAAPTKARRPPTNLPRKRSKHNPLPGQLRIDSFLAPTPTPNQPSPALDDTPAKHTPQKADSQPNLGPTLTFTQPATARQRQKKPATSARTGPVFIFSAGKRTDKRKAQRPVHASPCKHSNSAGQLSPYKPCDMQGRKRTATQQKLAKFTHPLHTGTSPRNPPRPPFQPQQSSQPPSSLETAQGEAQPAPPSPSSSPQSTFTFMTFNVMGGTAAEHDLSGTQAQHEPDCIIATELKLLPSQQRKNYLWRLLHQHYRLTLSLLPPQSSATKLQRTRGRGAAGVASASTRSMPHGAA